VAHDTTIALEAAGILFIESVGAYFLGRCLIRSKGAFVATSRFLFFIVAFLLPLALYESITSRPLALEILSKFASVLHDAQMERRWGLDRAQVVFEHPILYGVFCAASVGLCYYAFAPRISVLGRITRSALIALATFFSMSSGALVALAVQGWLIGWDWATRGLNYRWAILAGVFLAMYIAVDLYSTRSPVEVFVGYLTFSQHNAYGRMAIWEYGTAEVMRNPLFGIGHHEYERIWWLPASIDNFWLVLAVRHGIPGFSLFAGAFLLIWVGLARLRTDDTEIDAYRKGLLISLTGIAIAACTVHLWGAVFSLYMFLLGSGVWMIDHHPPRLSGTSSARRRAFNAP
jgi:hypothetical protein